MDRDLVHADGGDDGETPALGCAGLGCEDAVTHLLN